MFKRMLYGIVVMTASYVHSMEKYSPQEPKAEEMPLYGHCTNPYCLGDLPGRICRRAAINRIPFNTRDQYATVRCSWKYSLNEGSRYE
jgi:hypothetical protein